jgi:Uma2 family endonuclease
MMPHNSLITAAQFEQRYTNRSYELIAGRVVKVRLSGGLHGIVVNLIGYALQQYQFTHGIGGSIVANTGFWLSDQTLCAPDVAYFGAGKKAQIKDQYKFLPFAPDLAVEVVSSKKWMVQQRIELYQQANVPLIWMIYTNKPSIVVYHAGVESKPLAIDETLNGGELLPGFQVKVADLFPDNTKQDS